MRQNVACTRPTSRAVPLSWRTGWPSKGSCWNNCPTMSCKSMRPQRPLGKDAQPVHLPICPHLSPSVPRNRFAPCSRSFWDRQCCGPRRLKWRHGTCDVTKIPGSNMFKSLCQATWCEDSPILTGETREKPFLISWNCWKNGFGQPIPIENGKKKQLGKEMRTLILNHSAQIVPKYAQIINLLQGYNPFPEYRFAI